MTNVVIGCDDQRLVCDRWTTTWLRSAAALLSRNDRSESVRPFCAYMPARRSMFPAVRRRFFASRLDNWPVSRPLRMSYRIRLTWRSTDGPAGVLEMVLHACAVAGVGRAITNIAIALIQPLSTRCAFFPLPVEEGRDGEAGGRVRLGRGIGIGCPPL